MLLFLLIFWTFSDKDIEKDYIEDSDVFDVFIEALGYALGDYGVFAGRLGEGMGLKSSTSGRFAYRNRLSLLNDLAEEMFYVRDFEEVSGSYNLLLILSSFWILHRVR